MESTLSIFEDRNVYKRSKHLRVVVVGGVAVVVDCGGCKDSIRLPTVK